MKYEARKATAGEPYRHYITRDYQAVGKVEECDHVDGCWYCLTCDTLMLTDAAVVAHLYTKPKSRLAVHTLGWWCSKCDDPVVPHLRLP